MSKSLKTVLAVSAAVLLGANIASAGDAEKGAKVFKKCAACHQVGDGAKNKVGPHLNDLFGRKAGSIEGQKYSKPMIKAGEEGLVWNDETIAAYLESPKKFLPKTRMAFAGLKKDKDRENILAYLRTFSAGAAEPEKKAEAPKAEEKPAEKVAAAPAEAAKKINAADVELPKHGVLHLGRKATPAEIAAWDIDVRPDGQGLPKGSGSVAQGEELFVDQCAACHGDFGEGVDRWPILAGGQGTLEEERPEKTIGSYWPYLSTVFDYVKRAMPFGNAQSLSDDEVYAITAYLLYLNDLVEDEEFVLSHENFLDMRLPNEKNFIPDDRAQEPHYANKGEPCMTNCKEGVAEVTMRARVLDVTPDGGGDDNAGVGAVD